MRRVLATLTFLALLEAACSMSTQEASQEPNHPRNREPPDPRIEYSRKLAEGRRRGFGTCRDAYQIRELPVFEMGGDDNFFRVIGNFSDYRSCLVKMLKDEQAARDPYGTPPREGYTYGALAYDILLLSGGIGEPSCEPDKFSRQEARDIYAFQSWFLVKKNRDSLQACLSRRFGGT